MTRTVTLAIVCVLMPVAQAADLPRPGLYRTNVVMGAPGLVMEEVYAEEECLTTDDFQRGPDNYVSRRDDSSCEVREYTIGGGKVTMRLTCEFTGTTAAIVGVGKVGEERFEVDNDVKMVVAGLDLDLKAVLTGEYVADCAEPEQTQ